MWYGFGGRLRKTNWPAESVVVLRLNPVTGLVSSAVTATITPPVGSFTVPCTVPEPPSCASAGSARDRKITVAKLVVIFVLMIDAPWASWRPLIVRTRTRRHQTRCDEAAFNGLVIGAGARQEERAQERARRRDRSCGMRRCEERDAHSTRQGDIGRPNRSRCRACEASGRDSSDRPRVPRRARARELDDARDG